MKITEIPDNDLCQLAKMRLENERAKITITNIEIIDKKINSHRILAILFKTISKDWGEYSFWLKFDKFYINEFIFLQKLGIIIDENNFFISKF